MDKDKSDLTSSMSDESTCLLSRRKLTSLTGAAVGGAMLGSTGITAAVESDNLRTKDFGVATPGLTAQRVVGFDDSAYITSRSGGPVVVGEFGLQEQTITNNYLLPTGSGSWALTSTSNAVYVGTYWPGDLYRIDPENGTSTRVWQDPQSETGGMVIWNMDAVGDKVYMATYPEARVYEYDTATGGVRNYGSLGNKNDYARSISATEETLYVGLGTNHAQLIALDRQTGEQEDILPSEYGDQQTVYYLKTTEDYIFATLNPTWDILVIDRDDYSNHWVAEDINELALDGNTVYHTSNTLNDGLSLYRYDPDNQSHTQQFPVPYHAGDFVSESGHYVGHEGSGQLHVYDMNTESTATYDLLGEGMHPTAMTPQSVGTLEGTPIVASHGNLHVHHNPDHSEKINTPGEPKRMETIGDTLYQAIYPNAFIAKYELGDEEATIVADIGKEQNRPRDTHYQRSIGLLLVGTKPDYGVLGGAIAAYDVETGDLTVDRNVVQDQSVQSVTSIGNTAFLGTTIEGGANIEPTTDEARLVAWNPRERTKEWEITPVEGEPVISQLAAVNDQIYGVTGSDELFVVDPEKQAVIHRQSLDESAQVVVGPDRQIYSASNPGLLQIDPMDYDVDRFAESLTPAHGEVTISRDGDFYFVGADKTHLWKVTNKVEVGLTIEDCIDPKSHGVIPIKVDVPNDIDVDAESLQFGTPDRVHAGDGAAPKHGGHTTGSGLVLHFPTQQTGIESDGPALLAGSTTDGRLVIGTIDICVEG